MTLLEHDKTVWNRAAAMYAGSGTSGKLIPEGFSVSKAMDCKLFTNYPAAKDLMTKNTRDAWLRSSVVGPLITILVHFVACWAKSDAAFFYITVQQYKIMPHSH